MKPSFLGSLDPQGGLMGPWASWDLHWKTHPRHASSGRLLAPYWGVLMTPTALLAPRTTLSRPSGEQSDPNQFSNAGKVQVAKPPGRLATCTWIMLPRARALFGDIRGGIRVQQGVPRGPDRATQPNFNSEITQAQKWPSAPGDWPLASGTSCRSMQGREHL